jgi:hypothetical protein
MRGAGASKPTVKQPIIFITGHLRLFANSAARYRGYGLPSLWAPIADVISEGNVGLTQLKRFEPNWARQCQFDRVRGRGRVKSCDRFFSNMIRKNG